MALGHYGIKCKHTHRSYSAARRSWRKRGNGRARLRPTAGNNIFIVLCEQLKTRCSGSVEKEKKWLDFRLTCQYFFKKTTNKNIYKRHISNRFEQMPPVAVTSIPPLYSLSLLSRRHKLRLSSVERERPSIIFFYSQCVKAFRYQSVLFFFYVKHPRSTPTAEVLFLTFCTGMHQQPCKSSNAYVVEAKRLLAPVP